jgi:hypothetical protein
MKMNHQNQIFEVMLRPEFYPHAVSNIEQRETHISHTKEKNGKWYAGSVVERTSYRSSSPVVTVTDPDVLLPWKNSLTAKIKDQKGRDRSIRVFSKKEEPE